MSHKVKLIRLIIAIISEKKQKNVCCILGACSFSQGADLMTSTHKANAKWISSLQAYARTQINVYLYIRHRVHANKQLHTLTSKKQQLWPFSREAQADKRFPRGLTHSGLQRDCGYPQSPATDAKTRTRPISAPLPLLHRRSLAGSGTIAQTHIWNFSKTCLLYGRL